MFRSLIFITLLMSTSSFAQDTQKPCKCCNAEFRQFDFWVGEWEVFAPNGNKVGVNTIELIQDSCVLLENWESTRGGTGTSFSYYNQKMKNWNQLWLDNSGGNLSIHGSFDDGNMVLYTEEQYSEKNKTNFQDRVTWTDNSDGTVRQHWERTTDKGATWTTVFDGLYKRK